MTSFSASVGAWAAKSEKRIEAVFKESTKRVINDMQTPESKGGNMPVDTGFLRNSLQVGINAPKTGTSENPGGSFSWKEAEIALIIAGADLGDTVYATYSANYARHVEYGAQGRQGKAFVRSAAARWKNTVSRVAVEARQRAGN